MRKSASIRITACFVVASLSAIARAEDLTDEVNGAIDAGVAALLRQTREFDRITYHDRNINGPLKTVEGDVTRASSGMIHIKPRNTDAVVRIRRQLVESWLPAGYVEPELPEFTFGGPSALSAFALLSAGVDANEPRLARLIKALETDDCKAAGTYVHSLRAGVWSLLLDRQLSVKRRRQINRLINGETSWLTHAMSPDGAYDYVTATLAGDNSNTQFGNLGLWSCSIGSVEIPGSVWERVANYWLKWQHPGGGWSYRRGQTENSTASMTVAGCNSLYIALDRHYSRLDKNYALFRGCAPNREARKKMSRIYRAIEDGDKYLEIHVPDVNQNFGYELFGLERLGLASGKTQIGGVDWFRKYAPRVARRSWGGSPIADSFSLIFLVHGRAPVLFQKLEHEEDPNEWNYYHRDLFSLCRYMTRTFERLVRWQRIPLTARVETMRDAPFLYIAGNKALTLPPDARSRIREYVDEGGTVVLHADRRGKAFIESARSIFESMFAERELRFKPLDAEHPLYTCHFGRGDDAWKKHIPLEAIADGPRLLVILIPVDLAGAWHQEKRQYEDVWKIMANIRIYCAPSYNDMPLVLRSHDNPVHPAKHRGRLRIRRWQYAGEWSAHRGVWTRRGDSIDARTGLTLEADESGRTPDEETLASVDIVHLTTRGSAALTPGEIQKLKVYLEDGGLLLIESADGQSAGNAAVQRIVDALPVGKKGYLKRADPLATGEFPHGESILNLEATIDGVSLVRPGAPPPIITRRIDGRIAVIACPFDLSAALDHHHIWKRVGYTVPSTEKLVDNILQWRFDQIESRGTP